jgi:transposase
MARSSGKPIAKVAKELGASDNSLRNWLGQAVRSMRTTHGRTDPPHAREELKRLRRENEVLKQERDFLKKALTPSSQGG